MFAVLMWVVFSLAIILLARRLERSGIIWFFISLIISPLVSGIILLILGQNGKKCPKCAEKVKKDAHVCRHCGFDFTASQGLIR